MDNDDFGFNGLVFCKDIEDAVYEEVLDFYDEPLVAIVYAPYKNSYFLVSLISHEKDPDVCHWWTKNIEGEDMNDIKTGRITIKDFFRKRKGGMLCTRLSINAKNEIIGMNHLQGKDIPEDELPTDKYRLPQIEDNVDDEL